MAEKGYNDLEATIDRLKKQKELCQELLKNERKKAEDKTYENEKEEKKNN